MRLVSRRRKGFTLVEILIYTLLLAVVMGTAFALAHYFFSSHVIISQSEAMGSCARFFERLEDDLDNSMIRGPGDIQVGVDGDLLRFKRQAPGPPGQPDVAQDVVYRLEDPAFKKGSSSVLRNGRPIMGVSVIELWMEVSPQGALVVHAQLVDSRSRVPWVADSTFLVPAIQQALVFGRFVQPVPNAGGTGAAGGSL